MDKNLICTKCGVNRKQLSWICTDGMRVRKPLCKECDQPEKEMDKMDAEHKRELDAEERQDQREEEYREKHSKEFLIKFNGTLYVDALDQAEAISFAKDKDDLSEYVDNWEAE